MKKISIIIFVLLIGNHAFGEPQVKCKGNPEVVGECKTIRGRLSLYNGNPGFRIWIVGTNRMLGVVPSECEIMPEDLLNIFKTNVNAKVFADFEICPFTAEKEGHMQFVCIEAFSNCRVK